MANVSLRVNGRSYRFECDEDETAHLSALAAHLDGHISDLVGRHGAIADERLLIMAALMVADELFEARKQLADRDAEPQFTPPREPDAPLVAVSPTVPEFPMSDDPDDVVRDDIELLGDPLPAE